MRTPSLLRRRASPTWTPSCWSGSTPPAAEWSPAISPAPSGYGVASTCWPCTRNSGQSHTACSVSYICREWRAIWGICSSLQADPARFVLPMIWTCVRMCAGWVGPSRRWCSTRRRALLLSLLPTCCWCSLRSILLRNLCLRRKWNCQSLGNHKIWALYG